MIFRVAPPVALRTFVRSYAFNPKQTRKIVNNTTLALCSKFRDTQNREHVLSTSSLTCVTTQPQGKYSPRLHFISSSFSYWWSCIHSRSSFHLIYFIYQQVMSHTHFCFLNIIHALNMIGCISLHPQTFGLQHD